MSIKELKTLQAEALKSQDYRMLKDVNIKLYNIRQEILKKRQQENEKKLNDKFDDFVCSMLR